MLRRITSLLGAGLLVLSVAGPAAARPKGKGKAKPITTLERTVLDTDGDNLLEYAPGQDYVVLSSTEVPEDFRPPKRGSLLHFLQLSDFQIVDEESPGRVEFLDTTQRGPTRPFGAAYRPQESLTTHATEAMVRAVQRLTSPISGKKLAFTILTGDNADSQQYNETRWFIDILDGGKAVDPNSGVPTSACPGKEKSVYDGVRGGGPFGYYEPDKSGSNVEGHGYSPDAAENKNVTGGADVALRDFPGLFEAANTPFKSVGLKMPWYTAFGNHDALVQGNSGEAYVGPYGPSGEVANPSYHQVVTGCRKARNDSNPANPASFVTDLSSSTVVPPDDRRCFLAKDEPAQGALGPCADTSWIKEHFKTGGAPKGHGFVRSSELAKAQQDAGYGRPDVADANNDGYYSFSPRRGLRFVVLDTITDECGTPFCSEGSVDHPQFEWLRAQITKAAEMGQYVIVFSHHTLKTIRWPSTDPSEQPIHYGETVDRDNPRNPQNPSVETLEELYCQNPNVIAHVSGHEHENYIRHHTCEEESPPPLRGDADFWFVSSAAHIDWPQQARMLELFDNGDDKTMSLVATVVDHAGPARPPPLGPPSPTKDQVLTLASIAREISYNDYQADREALGEPEDRNVIMIVDRPWPYEPQK